jgi:hypothetical protein
VVTESRRDAGTVAVVPHEDASRHEEPDATAVIAEVPADAPDIVLVEDAPRFVVRPPRTQDAGTQIAVIPQTPTGRGTYMIQVITKPEGANLYAGHTYTGPSGTNIEQPPGTKMELQCRLRGYKPGTVSLVFDGKTEYVLCVLTRIKICIDNIKNPFDDCELDPNLPKP